MDISVLVTVKNDLENIRRLISSLKNVRENFELVIVDAFSDDGTYEFLNEERKNFTMILERKVGNRAVGRNRCIELSTGSRLAFLDSDSEIPDDWLKKIEKYREEKVLAGRIIQRSNKKWADLGRVPILYNGQDVTFPSNNLIYSREVIEKIGGFDTRFHTAEDVDLNIRAVKAGYKIKYAEDVIIYHYPRENYISLMIQSYYDGVGRRILKDKYGLGSKINVYNIKSHPFIESFRLLFGMMGYIMGDFDD